MIAEAGKNSSFYLSFRRQFMVLKLVQSIHPIAGPFVDIDSFNDETYSKLIYDQNVIRGAFMAEVYILAGRDILFPTFQYHDQIPTSI